jgi:hypothetical protein
MVHHVLQRFLLTLPSLWLVLTLVSMLRSVPPGMCSFRMIGESRQSVRMDKIR